MISVSFQGRGLLGFTFNQVSLSRLCPNIFSQSFFNSYHVVYSIAVFLPEYPAIIEMYHACIKRRIKNVKII